MVDDGEGVGKHVLRRFEHLSRRQARRCKVREKDLQERLTEGAGEG